MGHQYWQRVSLSQVHPLARQGILILVGVLMLVIAALLLIFWVPLNR